MTTRRRPAPDRRAAERAGRSAEDQAAAWLEARGWTILGRRVRGGRGSGAGEIDLVAVDPGTEAGERTLVFIEVKARPTAAAALESVTPAQRRRLAVAAEAWLAAHPDHAADGVRFDVVGVMPDIAPWHLADAWRPEG